MTPDPAIATAADYADALLTARRAKSLLTLVLLLILIIQLTIFFVAKYTDYIVPRATFTPSTSPANVARWNDILHYLIGLSDFLGVVLAIVLSMVLYLIVKVMLVGRLIGVSRVTSALIWSIVLVVLLFPWQAFLSNATFTSREFMIPGVLYTWDELYARVALGTRPGEHVEMPVLILHWARFVAWPVIALVLLLAIHARSNRGLKQALGEDTISDDVVTAPPAV